MFVQREARSELPHYINAVPSDEQYVKPAHSIGRVTLGANVFAYARIQDKHQEQEDNGGEEGPSEGVAEGGELPA